MLIVHSIEGEMMALSPEHFMFTSGEKDATANLESRIDEFLEEKLKSVTDWKKHPWGKLGELFEAPPEHPAWKDSRLREWVLKKFDDAGWDCSVRANTLGLRPKGLC